MLDSKFLFVKKKKTSTVPLFFIFDDLQVVSFCILYCSSKPASALPGVASQEHGRLRIAVCPRQRPNQLLPVAKGRWLTIHEITWSVHDIVHDSWYNKKWQICMSYTSALENDWPDWQLHARCRFSKLENIIKKTQAWNNEHDKLSRP